MSFTRMRASVLIGWSVAVLGAFAVRAGMAGLRLSTTEQAAWLSLLVLPMITFLTVFRGAPPATVAQILYTANHAADKDQK